MAFNTFKCDCLTSLLFKLTFQVYIVFFIVFVSAMMPVRV